MKGRELRNQNMMGKRSVRAIMVRSRGDGIVFDPSGLCYSNLLYCS